MGLVLSLPVVKLGLNDRLSKGLIGEWGAHLFSANFPHILLPPSIGK